jgi:hypothetical protein
MIFALFSLDYPPSLYLLVSSSWLLDDYGAVDVVL